MRKITLIYIDSGGGHRAAATALRDVIGSQGRPWEVEMVCIQNLFAPIDHPAVYRYSFSGCLQHLPPQGLDSAPNR